MDDNNISQNQTQIGKLENNVEFLVNAFKTYLRISPEDELPLSDNLMKMTEEQIYSISLAPELEEIEDFDVALETLNQQGNSRGCCFKKGTQKNKKGENPTSKTIVCKYKDRNKEKHGQNSKNEQKSKVFIKNIDCPVFYRFSIINEKINLTSFKEDHNHPPILKKQKELSPQMIIEISKFQKNSKISEVKDHIEQIFDAKLDYWSVYYQFRKVHPRFGEEDCKKFVNFLENNEAFYRLVTLEEDQSLTKLFFSTKLMFENFQDYGEILIVDTTYNTNYYSAPLFILSGVNNNYGNILFGIALINDETGSTYSWVLTQFKDIMKKDPLLIISDSDPSLIEAINKVYPFVSHRLCSWHILRNLHKKFNFLPEENQEIKKRIFSLPFLRSQEQFEDYEKSIFDFLKEKRFDKSIDYLKNLILLFSMEISPQHLELKAGIP